MSRCYSPGTVYGEHPERSGVRRYERLDCKRSACDHCGRIKAQRYRKAIAREAEAHGLTRFVTLTLDPKVAPGADPTKAEPQKQRVFEEDQYDFIVHFAWKPTTLNERLLHRKKKADAEKEAAKAQQGLVDQTNP